MRESAANLASNWRTQHPHTLSGRSSSVPYLLTCYSPPSGAHPSTEYQLYPVEACLKQTGKGRYMYQQPQ